MENKEKNELPKRKIMRLKTFDYNSNAAYFITICTESRRCILSRIVGTGVLDGPQNTHVELLPHGKIADKYIKQMSDFYNDVKIEQYVIMPNHIHLLLTVYDNGRGGPSRTPVPTIQNSTTSRFISTFKRFCNKEYGENIWQRRSYDHVIRNRKDYDKHKIYIYENPVNWHLDELYSE